MNLAFFDFDGTLTTEDTFTQFITFATPRVRLVLGYMLLFPCIFLYKFGVISASKMRRMIVRIAFWRANQADVETLAEAFVKKRIPALMSVEMMVSLERHRQRGDRIVIVSASLSVYLRHWAKQHNVELICSELCVSNGRYTGTYRNGDCSGINKVKAIGKLIDLQDYETVYAYGDTEEDMPMLRLADKPFYKGKPLANKAFA